MVLPVRMTDFNWKKTIDLFFSETFVEGWTDIVSGDVVTYPADYHAEETSKYKSILLKAFISVDLQ